ncbi:hypothetical protein [Helicobacter cetorum]|uniref:Uncharacterized protein n=1 Tax=Helicobacter cetorum (strain ATCC BAA-429 / MIT 00-7128) TaxID=182217 RepID=I0EL76_HELC0|nr:hypothetical protein [Helicobacter cetorum]AFI03695.1 hypothetical protein HCW_02050 [Helicobacter cetorum MIT 00-7128]
MPKNNKYYKKDNEFHSTATHRKLTGGARNNCEMKEMGGQKVVMECAKLTPKLIELVIKQDEQIIKQGEQINSLKQIIMALSPIIYEKMQRNFK